MELKEFVSQTLIQIIEGIKIAQNHSTETNADIASGGVYEKIEFDVAVTTTDTTEARVGAGIFVAAVSLGAQAKGGVTNQTLSHIRFSVPMYLPYEEKR